ncbi:MAG: hypothetical protein II243_03330 [Lachnospiraceae bacterium]|nr:hypothetical protein [Lachnospiraceae bacterium]
MQFKLTKQWLKSFIMMLIAVIIMGLGVSLFVLVNLGTDPCSSMNYGVARQLGISFGNYQLIFNIVLLIIVIIFDRSLIGTGTIGNMVLVGYSADFFTFIWNDVLKINTDLTIAARIGILIPALMIFVISAAVYMNSGHGTAPYDSVPLIICRKLEKATGKEDLFKPVRLSVDLTSMVIGFFTGGEVGIMTVLMVILLAPTVSYVGHLFERKNII